MGPAVQRARSGQLAEYDSQTRRAMTELKGPDRAARLVVGMGCEHQAQLLIRTSGPSVWSRAGMDWRRSMCKPARRSRRACVPLPTRSGGTRRSNPCCGRSRRILGSTQTASLGGRFDRIRSVRRLNTGLTRAKAARSGYGAVEKGDSMTAEDKSFPPARTPGTCCWSRLRGRAKNIPCAIREPGGIERFFPSSTSVHSCHPRRRIV